MSIKLYKILTLEQAEEYRKVLFEMGEDEHNPTIIRDRTQYLWLESLVEIARGCDYPIFLKNNLKEIWKEPLIQEFPI